ncbi:hypothetical protein [Anatilimnocola floriformis]|uniref:hypothetical protein n=1 Tax=Anatilimnocola floriformis TaxID=2948575 RepID=UPI0020C3E721|nr:hypothetical protein [Anatilimnocola floriformis]
MPLLITYRGKPVKRRFRLGSHLKLIFFAPARGQSGDQLIVTQQEWDRDGRIQFVTRQQMPDLRRLADYGT